MGFLDKLFGWVKKHTGGKAKSPAVKGGPPQPPPPVQQPREQAAPRLIVPTRPKLVHSGGAARFVYEGEELRANLSSNVSSMKYSVEDQEITVEYQNGAVWAYGNFSEQEALWVYEAGSKGTVLWDLVRVRGKGSKHRHKKPARRVR